MIDALKRRLGLSQAPVVEAETQKDETVELAAVEAVVEAAVAQTEVVADTALAALETTVASLTEQLAANAAELADKDAKIAELTALVEAAVEFKAAQEKAAAEAKIAARTTALSALVGTEQASVLQVALASLDDTAFDVALAAMSSKMRVEEKSEAFTEVGVEGTTDAVKLAADAQGSRVKDYLKTVVAKEIQAN